MRFIVILLLVTAFIGVENRPSLDQEAYEDDEEAEDSADEAPNGTPLLGVAFDNESEKGSDIRVKQSTDERSPRSSKFSKENWNEQPQGKFDTSTEVVYDSGDAPAPAGADTNKNVAISDLLDPSDEELRFSDANVFKNKRTRHRQEDLNIGKRTVGNRRYNAAVETEYRPQSRLRENEERMEDNRLNYGGGRVPLDSETNDNKVDDMYRGRRDTQPVKDGSVSTSNSTVNEDEEAVIKRHVNKLSKDELDELFQSLSDDKKYLLKKIMESSAQDLDNLEKREITKKEGAAGLIDSSPVGNNKIVNSLNSFFTSSPSDINAEKTNKDMGGDSVSVSPNIDQLVNQLSPESDRANNAKIAVMSTDSEQTTTSKVEIKRDVKCDGMLSDESHTYFNEDEGFVDQGEESSIETDTENNVNMQKRDTSDLTGDSVGSLQDSFPNLNNCDEMNNAISSDMEPLVRVKRTEIDGIANYAAMQNPSGKCNVAFCPLKAENSDDNCESNEYDNEIADSSDVVLAKADSHNKSPKPMENIPQNEPTNTNTQQSKEDAAHSECNLGSDSDSVLSGVEEVDENLMYGNIEQDIPSDTDDQNMKNSRIRRSADDNESHDDLAESVKVANSRSDIYQENVAFGSLPRSYEGELARYKRIRKVKEHPSNELHK